MTTSTNSNPTTISPGRLARITSSKPGSILIAVGWLLILAVAGGFAAKLSDAQDNRASSWLPGSAESTKVLSETKPFFDENEFPALAVYHRADGVTQADLAAVAAQVTEFNTIKYVQRDVDATVFDPETKQGGIVVSQDGQAILVTVPINGGSDGWDAASTAVDSMKTIMESTPDGLAHYVTGPGGYAAESAEAFSGIDGKLLLTASLVVVVILLFTYRSPVLWMLPLLSAGVALTVAQAVIYALVQTVGLTVNAQSFGILTVLVFGAGTDYALLLVARYREELRRHADRHEAMAVALHRAGPAIFASGATVVAGMICLMLASMNSTAGLGPVCAVGILVALLVMLTLLPALLVILGRWIFWPLRPTFGSEDTTESSLWARVGRGISVRPRATWVVTTLVLGALCLALFQLGAGTLKNRDQFYGTPPPVKGEDIVAAHFPGGAGSPVDVVAKAERSGEVAAALAGVKGVASVAPPRVKGDVAYIAATLSAAPDTTTAQDTVDRVRDTIHSIEGAEARAGGAAATNLDIQRAADHDNRVIIPAVLTVVFLILTLLLRALVAPLVLVATVVLSYGAALGLSALMFKHLFHFAGADIGLPLFVFVFLVALGIDYNIFLMTRVHEESRQVGTRRGALVGLGATGGVITSAGLVLAGTFAALGTLPVVPFAEIGIAVAVGVLLDTIVVRAILVTALNLDIGRWMWWPSAMAHTDKDAAPDSVAGEPVSTGAD